MLENVRVDEGNSITEVDISKRGLMLKEGEVFADDERGRERHLKS